MIQGGDMRYSFPMIIPIAFSRVWHWITARYYACLTWILAFAWGVKCGRHVRFQGKTIIRTRHSGEIVLGDGVVFNSQSTTNLVGLLNPTILDTLGGGKIEVGDDSGFSSVVMSSHSSITIGRHVKVGGNVRIFDHDFHSLDPIVRRGASDIGNVRTRPIVIGDDVFVGTNAIILKGTSIGARSIVAAGSVVFGLDIPPDSLVKGNPAIVVAKMQSKMKG